MVTRDRYQWRLEQEHAFLFWLAPDGTVSMRVLSMGEWKERVSGMGPGHDEDAVQQVFLEDPHEVTPQLAASQRTT